MAYLHAIRAIPWVIGVMASDPANSLAWFSNYDPRPYTRYEYEVRAPGVSIYSTLPGNRYAAWSGTSMATPIVSGIAALMRSFFWQREVYSSRYLMGSIVSSKSEIMEGGSGGVVDAYKAITTPPTPGVSFLENWIFDDKWISEKNNSDGGVDSGETIQLALKPA